MSSYNYNISQFCSRLINKPFWGLNTWAVMSMFDLILKFQNWTCTLKLFKPFSYSYKQQTQRVNEGNTSNKIFKP